jgi:hypothetical protein
MNVSVRRPSTSIGFAAAAVLVAAAPAAATGPVLDPGPITPNQTFVGVVNGTLGPSRIAVVCDGPEGPAGRPDRPPVA